MWFMIGRRVLQELPMPWLFDDAPATGTYMSAAVLGGAEELSCVIRDHDGDWLFLGDSECSTADQLRLICLQDALMQLPHAVALCRLPVGWYAEWQADENTWELCPLEEQTRWISVWSRFTRGVRWRSPRGRRGRPERSL
jgi:hypothetical protein